MSAIPIQHIKIRKPLPIDTDDAEKLHLDKNGDVNIPDEDAAKEASTDIPEETRKQAAAGAKKKIEEGRKEEP